MNRSRWSKGRCLRERQELVEGAPVSSMPICDLALPSDKAASGWEINQQCTDVTWQSPGKVLNKGESDALDPMDSS